jgi:hypothetical protein
MQGVGQDLSSLYNVTYKSWIGQQTQCDQAKCWMIIEVVSDSQEGHNLFHQCIQTDSVAHPSSYPIGTRTLGQMER